MKIQVRTQGLPDENINNGELLLECARIYNKHLKHSVVQEWVRGNNMSFGCILETKVKESKAEGTLNKVFSQWSHMTNYEHSKGGRIWLVWCDGVCMILVYKTDHLITCFVGLLEKEEFFFTCVYANNTAEGRNGLWEDLCHHQDSTLFRNKAWFLVGDFNEILDAERVWGLKA